MKTKCIPLNPGKIPKPLSNPAAALVRDTLNHRNVSQVAAANAMNISKAQLNDVIRQKKGVSASFALRFQLCFGIPGEFLLRLQGLYDFQKAFHAAKNANAFSEVKVLA
jgi:addiction module HigA family antidote